MQPARLPELLALAASLLPLGCASNHHVSPWGGSDRPSLGAFVERPDLPAQIARIDAETASHALRLVTEIRADLPRGGGPALLRGYEGLDALGRQTRAVRVATGHGVVIALGPLDARDPLRDQAVELVPALMPAEERDAAGAFRSGTDLNGDGALDVVIRSETGRLELFRIGLLGADMYKIEMMAPPTRAIHIEGDTRIGLFGEVALNPDDAIAPHFTDVATFDRDRYSNATPAARAFHARLAAPSAPSPPASSAPPAPSAPPRSPPPPAPPLRDEARLASALERAWHAVLSGKPKEEALKELAREPVPRALRDAFDRHSRRIAALSETSSPKPSSP
jgi:hypothetical protein